MVTTCANCTILSQKLDETVSTQYFPYKKKLNFILQTETWKNRRNIVGNEKK